MLFQKPTKCTDQLSYIHDKTKTFRRFGSKENNDCGSVLGGLPTYSGYKDYGKYMYYFLNLFLYMHQNSSYCLPSSKVIKMKISLVSFGF